MTDYSDFVLRWEIDNAEAVKAAGKAESEVFNEGGFKWTAKAEKNHFDAKFTVGCGVGQTRPWKCQANVSILLLRTDGLYTQQTKEFLFDNNNDFLFFPDIEFWTLFTMPIYAIDDKVRVEFHVRIISSEGHEPIAISPSPFAEPNNRSDVILKIGDKKLHASKEYLAVQSPFFENLFFGEYLEKGKDEVEIKDVLYEEFHDLLNVIYLENVKITDRLVAHILKLADRFQMKRVLDMSKEYLIESKGIDVVQKLVMADKYRLDGLRDFCLKKFSSVAELHEKLKSSTDLDNSSDAMKAAIYGRIMKLKLQMTGNSNFVLRWEKGNTAAACATGKAESGVFNEGGFKWTAKAERNEYDCVDFTLACGSTGNNRNWKCEADVKLRLTRADGTSLQVSQRRPSFNDANTFLCLEQIVHWEDYYENSRFASNWNAVEFHIDIINADRGESLLPSKFAAPNNKSNVILKIGDKKVHVSKEYLGFHSPVFDTLFFGNFAENGKEEVEVKDVVYEEFIDLLNVIYLENVKITDHTVMHLLKLADQFQIECVREMTKEHLIESKGIDLVQKLIVADQYRLADLKNHCLKSLSSVAEVTELFKSPEVSNFSDEMKAAVFNHQAQLIQGTTATLN